MKRTIITLVLAALMCYVGFAMDFHNGITSGGFCVMENNLGEGYGEWGFPVFQSKKGFMIRDCVSIGGFGGTNGKTDASGRVNISIGGFSVGNKILFGQNVNNNSYNVKTYGLCGVEFSLFAAENHKMFSPSGYLSTIFGGGFEFQYTEKNAFVTEFGGKYRYVIGKDNDKYSEYNCINPVLMIGFRSYY